MRDNLTYGAPQLGLRLAESICLNGSLLPNPKQARSDLKGRAGWYPYYAGYSAAFVSKVLEQASLSSSSAVLDPWNGAGTTTQVAHDIGLRAFGFDLNPAMAIIARSRLLGLADVQRIRGWMSHIQMSDITHKFRPSKEPLSDWFSTDAVAAIRRLELSMRHACGAPIFPEATDDAGLATLYTCLFRTLKRCLAGRRSKNPTWLKMPRQSSEKVHFTFTQLRDRFAAETSEILESLDQDISWPPAITTVSDAVIGVATAAKLPLPDSCIDCIVSSPPYCTRIDYAVATSVELAVLGLGKDNGLRRLRDEMTGTSTVRPLLPEPRTGWGSTCLALLNRIDTHSSKASQSYYLKMHLQYFDDLYKSLSEAHRCIRPGASCILVVQDSYYKDVHNDLSAIICEMSQSFCWKLVTRTDFKVARTMVGLNGHARRYLQSRTPIESVIWFIK